jgi:hypothetical protein
MSGLSVEPDDLDSYGKLLDRVGDQAVSAQKYLDKNSKLAGAEGLFIKIVNPASHHAVYAAHEVFNHLEKAGRRSNTGLTDAAVYYRKTEHETAARVDATYPKAARPLSHNVDLGIAPVQTHHFKEKEDPLTHLTEPEAGDLPESPKTPLDHLTAAFEAISPSTAVISFLEMVTGHNVAEEAGEWFAGDWKSYAECGNAFENVGSMMNSISTNIQEGANELGNTWQGNAGDAAQVFFNNLGASIGQQETVFSAVGGEYTKAASGIARLAEEGAALYKAIIDHCIIGAMAMAAGAASSETGVGGLIGGGTAAYEAYEVLEGYEKFTKIRESGTILCKGFVAGVDGRVSDLSMFQKYPLPAAGYESPMES